MAEAAPEAPWRVAIQEIGHGGEGVGRAADGQVVFVPGAVPGDVVEVRVQRRQPRFVLGELVRVVEPSPARQVPPCPVVEACGGCPVQVLRPEAQREGKRRRLIGLLHHLGRLPRPPVAGVEAPGANWDYRAKASLVAGEAGDGLRLGFYARGSHRLVPAVGCLVADPAVRRAAAAVEGVARRLQLAPYDEERDRGFLRHVVIRHAPSTDQLLVLLVTRHAGWPGFDRFPDGLRRELGSSLTCLAQSVHPGRSNRVLGGPPRLLAGEPAIWEEMLGVRLRISPGAFFQVNPRVAQAMYAAVMDGLGIGEGDRVLDAHAGVGAMALIAARRGAWAIGYETVPEAVADARAGAAASGLADRCRFALGRAETLYPKEFSARPPDAVILDPPRSGLDPALVATLRRRPPARLAYVSCDGATLARDLRLLLGDGRFFLHRVVPYDLFPHTGHLEAVAFLTAGRPGPGA